MGRSEGEREESCIDRLACNLDRKLHPHVALPLRFPHRTPADQTVLDKGEWAVLVLPQLGVLDDENYYPAGPYSAASCLLC